MNHYTFKIPTDISKKYAVLLSEKGDCKHVVILH